MIVYTSYAESAPRPLFSILIPTWNNLAYLRLCVDSIRKNSRFKHQIVLHINDGSDGSREWARSQQIDHSQSDENRGVCYALNAAYSLSQADYIVYMNDDMYVCPDWDYHLWQEIRQAADENFFFSATAIEPLDVGKRCALAPHAFGRTPDDFDEQRLLDTYAALEYHDWNGASWPPSVVHRKLWDLIGGYSTEFFPGFYSDPDFAMKLWQAGVRNFKGVAKSRVYHFLEVSTNKLKRRKVKQANALFLKKWGLTARMFNCFYLRMGTPHAGLLAEPERNLSYIMSALRCKLKRLIQA